MVNVIESDTIDGFNWVLYPEQHPNTKAWLQNQFNSYSNTLTDIGRNFLQTSEDIYKKIYSSEAIRLGRAVARMAKGIMHPNVIRPIYTLQEAREAQTTMQRYIMACPEIRDYYYQNKCDGYSDTYLDLYPGFKKHLHYDYMRVMDGIMEDVVDEDGNDTWEVHTYGYEMLEQDEELDIDQKTDIISTWDLVRLAITAGQDPTDIYGGELGPLI